MLILDCEIFRDFFLVALLDESGDVLRITARGPDGQVAPPDRSLLRRLLESNTTGGFNSAHFDLPLLALATDGANVRTLKGLCDTLIGSKLPAHKVCAELGIVVPERWDHIDIIDVAPGTCSLKMYAARLGLKSIADLPFAPDAELSDADVATVTDYCDGDVRNTRALFDALSEQSALRVVLGERYGMDLRSASDASIAERVLVSEVRRRGSGRKRRGGGRHVVPDGHTFSVTDPGFVGFDRPDLVALCAEVLSAELAVNSAGRIALPKSLEGRKIRIGASEYKIGIGGLHSTEKRRTLRADDDHALFELDVASFYPSLILQQRISPKSLGAGFQSVYRDIVERRLKAKAAGDKNESQTLKIVILASFGKLGSQYSPMYSPELFAQVTITGQLAILMLIERLEAAGVAVYSANTDGIVVRPHRYQLDTVEAVAWGWMLDTSFELERTDYAVLAQRDVNSYIAIGLDGTAKRKGVFACAGLSRNPGFEVVGDAVVAHLAHGVPVADVVLDCDDLTAFCAARRVSGGAVWRGEVLGRTARWYLSTDCGDEPIRYARNSNAVPQSAGARPVQTLPDELPDDIDRGRYVAMAVRALEGVGIGGEPVMTQGELL